ncbi:MAG: redox-sensing transcriptional repressor Rex [Lachnospiraceae bacterium]|nr:redox-sensing transcriptional repressor Rex [Lachnospiraceae bacterium]
MDELRVSGAIIRRLPRYYRYLEELMHEGVERISSQELASRMRVTASQIRQDLNHFGGFGQQGYGYKVDALYEAIGKIMGIDRVTHIILVGAGHLGQALANYTNYRRRGFMIEAIFDKDPARIGTDVQGITVRDVETLEEYVAAHNVDIATITIPKEQAVLVADRLVKAGIKAIWNFAHTDLEVPKDVAVENVHLSESLMNLSYKLKEMQDSREA